MKYNMYTYVTHLFNYVIIYLGEHISLSMRDQPLVME